MCPSRDDGCPWHVLAVQDDALTRISRDDADIDPQSLSLALRRAGPPDRGIGTFATLRLLSKRVRFGSL